jgi:hypothetical protein
MDKAAVSAIQDFILSNGQNAFSSASDPMSYSGLPG